MTVVIQFAVSVITVVVVPWVGRNKDIVRIIIALIVAIWILVRRAVRIEIVVRVALIRIVWIQLLKVKRVVKILAAVIRIDPMMGVVGRVIAPARKDVVCVRAVVCWRMIMITPMCTQRDIVAMVVVAVMLEGRLRASLAVARFVPVIGAMSKVFAIARLVTRVRAGAVVLVVPVVTIAVPMTMRVVAVAVAVLVMRV